MNHTNCFALNTFVLITPQRLISMDESLDYKDSFGQILPNINEFRQIAKDFADEIPIGEVEL